MTYTPPPPPVTPPQKRGGGFGRILLISCGVVMFACCACAGVAGFAVYQYVPAAQAALDLSSAFASNNYQSVADVFAPDLLERLGGKANFVDGLTKMGLDKIDNWNLDPSTFRFSETEGYISGPATVGGTVKTLSVEFKKIEGKWLVADIKLTSR